MVDIEAEPEKVNPALAEVRHAVERLRHAVPEADLRPIVAGILKRSGNGARQISELKPEASSTVLFDLRCALPQYLISNIGPVLPLRPKTKITLPGSHGVLDATEDMRKVRAWVKRHGNLNWGMTANAIDIDARNGGLETWAKLTTEHGEPDTLIVETPTTGLHVYVTDAIPQGSHNLGPGIDTRAKGKGYVVAPGSDVVENKKERVYATGFYKIKSNKPKASIPWAAAKLGEAKPTGEKGQAPVGELDTPDAIERATEMLKSYAASPVKRNAAGKQTDGPAIQDQGGDPWTVQVAMDVGDLGISEATCLELMFEHFNPACIPPWSGDDETGNSKDRLSYKVASAYKSRGSAPGADTGTSDFVAADDDAGTPTGEKAEDPTDPEYPEPLTFDKLMDGQFERVKYSVAGLIMRHKTNLIYGDGGIGKTTVAVQMGFAVSAGCPIFYRDTIQDPVLLVLGEDDYNETKPKIEAMRDALGITNSPPISIWCLPGHDISLVKISDDGSKIVYQPFYRKLVEKLEATPGLFVVLDSLVDIAQMAEKDRPAPNAFFKKVLASLCDKYRATIVVLGHPSKAAMKDGSWYSGSTAYRNAVRNMLVMKQIEESVFRSLIVLKQNYGPADEKVRLVWADGIFVAPGDAAILASYHTQYQIVLKKIYDLIDKKLNVSKHGNSAGHTPKAIAKSLLDVEGVDIKAATVKAFMYRAEEIGDLVYSEGKGHTIAHYERPGSPDEFFGGRAPANSAAKVAAELDAETAAADRAAFDAVADECDGGNPDD